MHRMLPAPYLLGSLVLGIMALLNIVWLRHNAISTAIAIVLYLVVFTLAFFGGRSAKMSALRPALFGALIGVSFGVIAGLGSFLVRDSLRDIDVPAHLSVKLKLLAWANSPGGHIAALVTAMVAFGVISLVVGAIGGVSVKDPNRPRKA